MKRETTNNKNHTIIGVLIALVAAMSIYLVVRPKEIPMEDYLAIALLSTSVIVFTRFAKTKHRRQLILGIFFAVAGILCMVTFFRKLLGA